VTQALCRSCSRTIGLMPCCIHCGCVCTAVNGDGFDDIAVVDSESGGGVYLLFLGNYGQLLSFVKAPSSGGAFVVRRGGARTLSQSHAVGVAPYQELFVHGALRQALRVDPRRCRCPWGRPVRATRCCLCGTGTGTACTVRPSLRTRQLTGNRVKP
jgi:hypothetical protein